METPTMSLSTETVVMQTLAVSSIMALTPPLVLHWKNRNFPAAIMMAWFIVLNIFSVANAFIWPTDDFANWWDGAGLCDIEVKMMIASYIAIPGSLPGHSCPEQASTLDKPFHGSLVLHHSSPVCGSDALHLPRQPLFYLWRLRMHYQSRSKLGEPRTGLYMAACGLVLFRLKRYRNRFNEIIRAADSGTNKSRFLRLFFLAFVMLVALVPLQAYVVYVQIKLSLPWHAFSWSLIHGPGSSAGVIQMVPGGGKVYFDRWIPITAGYVAFIFFGTGRDASRMYRSLLRPFGLDCCFSPTETTSSGSSRPTAGSGGSRAHLVPKRSQAQDDLYHSARTNSTDCTFSSETSYKEKDLEKGTSVSRVIEAPGAPREEGLKTHFAWFRNPFSRSASADKMRSRSTPNLAVPTNSNTVCSNAWAGTSQSRGSIDLVDLTGSISPRTDFIRVKQVIRQEELQV
ncbi:uncharacterized protein DSM5745_06976 [Aspergillus mulundensis]|uniref:A-pheromone receptor PreA n=1 Tax=Aspergillus mulundensis TaxID=1810919 RepID=A0A3D8RK85_9EURO|nr:hypothetical protein DSM5745_06976 [Aspergillus mulundensis]RDW74314.1 hypothetical protein DSM5745_06976 [Aspergillus mulundensis]